MKKKITVLFITALILTAVPFMSPDSDMNAYASSTKTKTGTVYTDVIKHGNTVYCMVYDIQTRHRLYKVDLKRGKAKLIKRNIVNSNGMLYKNGYIYFTEFSVDYRSKGGPLYRINVKTGKKKKIAKSIQAWDVPQFLISKKTIYYTDYKYDYEYGYGDIDAYNEIKKTKKMTLNGKNKKNAKNIKIKVKAKKSNAKGYKIKYVGESVDKKFYLVKPNGSKIYLGTTGEYY